ncbi:LPS translocon maturation chaperone LptM [Thalassotalea piscium]|uniref:Putative small lipoprotein YifL n=1 Tax=Thalassotalea piscium TaxID=1230533 RepID=A0A7X0NFP2_9GAMM|nr:hypothetical protein [Thalassotalea piscium]MBB6542575.1 putative small lipoprotein YifL [Thalassotalea piscium]
MRKLNSLKVAFLLLSLLLSGCGMPGPLYQTPETNASETPKNNNLPDQKAQENP